MTKEERQVLVFVSCCLLAGVGADYIKKRQARAEWSPAPAWAKGSTAQEKADRIDINRASVDELVAVKGIGPKTAGLIVEYRERNGGFFSVDDLARVKGMGAKRLEKIRPFVSAE